MRPNIKYDAHTRYPTLNLSLFSGTNYYFRMRSVNSTGQVSDWVSFNGGNAVSAPLYVPTIDTPTLSANVVTPGNIELSWSAISGAVSYKLDRASTPSMVGSYNPKQSSNYIPLTQTNGLSYTFRSCIPERTYYFRLRAVDAGSADSIGHVISVTTPSVPTAPRELRAEGDEGCIRIRWNFPNESGVDHYALYRSETSGGQGTNAYAIVSVGLKYTDTDVTPGTTYYYTVAGVRSDSDLRSDDTDPTTAQSGEASAAAVRVLCIVEAATSAENPVLDGEVDLSVLGEKEGSSANLTYEWSQLSEFAGPTFTPNDSSAASNAIASSFGVTNETYILQAAASDGRLSVYSVLPQTVNADTNAPASPTNFTAVAGDGDVELNWVDSSDADFEGYNVYRSPVSGSGYLKLNDALLPASAYTDTGATNAILWHYVVTAVDYAGNESSNSVERTALPENILPATPLGLVGLAGFEKSTLDWYDNSETDLLGYNLSRSQTDGGPYSKLTSEALGVSVYIDSAVTNNEIYYYVITAVDTQGGESPYSVQAVIEPGTDVTPPHYPVGLDSDSGDAEITVDWASNVELDLAGYNLFRGITPNTGDYVKINSSLLTSSSYLDSPVTNEITYYYWVTAVDESGNESVVSPDYTYVTAHNAPPAKPTGLDATAGALLIDLIWDDNTEVDLAGYNLYRSDVSSSGPFSQIADTNTLNVSTSEYTDTNVTALVKYWYVVRAVDIFADESYASSTVSATPTDPFPPSQPIGLTATVVGRQIELAWDDNPESDLDGYLIYHSVEPGGTNGYVSVTGNNLLENSAYSDSESMEFEVTNYYYVTALDTSKNESTNSATVGIKVVWGNAPLWKEPFAYSTGDLESTSGWYKSGSGSNSPPQVTSGSLDVQQLNESGGKVSIVHSADLASPQSLRSSSIQSPYIDLLETNAYASFAVQVNSISNSATGYGIPSYVYKGNNYCPLLLKQGSDTNHYQLGVKYNMYSGSTVYATNEFEMGSAQWVVFKLSAPDGTNGLFKWDLFLNPSVAAEPEDPDATTSYGTVSGATTRVSGFALTSGENSGSGWADYNIDIDEMALDKKWPGDTTPPMWMAGYPLADGISSNHLDVIAKTDENAVAYYVALTNGATAPSVAQVRAGQDASGTPVAAGRSGSIALSVETEGTNTVTALSETTPYDIYLVAEDTSINSNLQTEVRLLEAETLDLASPVWADSYPQLGAMAPDGFEVLAKINEMGSAYYVVLTNGASAPSVEQVKAGQDASGVPVATDRAGSISLTAETEGSDTVTGLDDLTAYDIYVISEDVYTNLQSTATLVETTTPDGTPPSWQDDFPKAGTLRPDGCDLLGKIDEDGSALFVVLDDGVSPPTAAQVKAGTDAADTPLAAHRKGSFSLLDSIEGSGSVSNLAEVTDYDVYMTAQDIASNLQGFVRKINILTTDSTPPVWQGSSPEATSVGSSGFDLLAEINEDGTAYYVVLPDSASAPSAAQVKAGQDAAGASVDANLIGSIELTADTENSSSVTGLSEDTAYDIYTVAEDGRPNVQAAPSLIELTTLIAPEIEISGKSVNISSGDSTPEAADSTRFVETGIEEGLMTNVFEIFNTGDEDLLISNIVLQTDGTPFALLDAITNETITSAQSISFRVTFDPDAVGVRSNTVIITHNDPDGDESPFTFAIDAILPTYPLPWEETFENDGTNSGTLGALNTQNGWIAGDGATVQTGTVHAGSQALSLQKTTASHAIDDAQNNVLVEFNAKFARREISLAVDTGTAVAIFQIDTNGYLVAYSNETPVTITNTTLTDDWHLFEAQLDYNAKTWSMKVDDTLLVDDFAFYSVQSNFAKIAFSSGTNATFVDGIRITNIQAADSDNDGIPDTWENIHYKGITNAIATNLCANGINTVLEAYIAGLNPTNASSIFEVSNVRNILQWSVTNGRIYSIYWSSNLLSGFQSLESNLPWTAMPYTDTNHPGDDKGFYKIEVELE